MKTLLAFYLGATVALKLFNVIHWSWWWIMSPIWIPLVLLAVVVIIAMLAIKDVELIDIDEF